jgi:molybdopterin-guanine dinucleotide biosynthesis protein
VFGQFNPSVTITGMTGHDAGIIGHDHRNTQLQLVDGTKTEIRAAEREEWRARSQRHKWISERVDMAGRITLYDLRLVEAWKDRHALMVEQTGTVSDAQKRSAGLEIFRWAFNNAMAQISPFAKNWSADYYVRGSYQFLAVDLRVGWHPDFEVLLRAGA